MKIRKFLIALVVASLFAVIALAGCAPTKIPAGKYCAEGNLESYIEVFDDRTMLFVNIDFSEVENDDGVIASVGHINIEKIFDGKPQEYSELFYDEDLGLYHCYVTITDGIALFIEWSDKDNCLIFDTEYKLQ